MECRRIGRMEIHAIRELFLSVFTREPWNDDWSDREQLELYLSDLTDQSNSLTFGLYDGDELIGVSMGQIRHWYEGTEYNIAEFCIRTERQGRGAGTFFLKKIEDAIRDMGLVRIFLLTEKTMPAYFFYQKNGFYELKNNTAFTKHL